MAEGGKRQHERSDRTTGPSLSFKLHSFVFRRACVHGFLSVRGGGGLNVEVWAHNEDVNKTCCPEPATA